METSRVNQEKNTADQQIARMDQETNRPDQKTISMEEEFVLKTQERPRIH